MVKKCNTNVHHEEYNLKEVVTENNILGSLHRLNILGQMESRKKKYFTQSTKFGPPESASIVPMAGSKSGPTCYLNQKPHPWLLGLLQGA